MGYRILIELKDSCSYGRCCITLALIFVVAKVFCMSYAVGNALAFEKREIKGCKECHEEVYSRSKNSRYRHSPVAEGRCQRCHIASRFMPSSRREIDKSSFKKRAVLRYSDDIFLKEHLMVIKGLDRHDICDIKVSSKTTSGIESVVEMGEVNLAEIIGNMGRDNTPPEIIEVSTPKFTVDLWGKAKVKWRTNEPTNGYIEYGKTEKYGLVTPAEDVWKKFHETVLFPLERDTVYYFRIVCRDIYGNITSSRGYKFFANFKDTAKGTGFAGDDGKKIKGLQSNEPFLKAPVIEDVALTYLDGCFLSVCWRTDIPSDSKVEIIKEINGFQDYYVKKSESKLMTKLHGGKLLDELDCEIRVCYTCHPEDILGLSHPVGVPLKEGMNPPEDIPVTKSRIITCVSCHEPHGGNYAYMCRKREQEELCIGCHGKNF